MQMHDGTGAIDNPSTHNYSTLEVAIGAPDYDKEVVHPSHYSPHNSLAGQQQYDQQQQLEQERAIHLAGLPVVGNGPAPGGETGKTAAGLGPGPGPAIQIPAAEERRILGLKRRTFFIVAWVITLIIAVAIGVGAGLGATMRSRNGDSSGSSSGGGGSGGAAAATTTSESETVLPTSSPATTENFSSSVKTIPTTSPPPSSSPPTISSKTTRITTTTTIPQIGGPGGRCVNEWGSDCICLDDGICVNKWKGTPYTGFEGNWPCPDDPENIMACIVKPCLGQVVGGQTQCLWREGCSEVLDLGAGGTGAAICPGDGDFVCCAHPW